MKVTYLKEKKTLPKFSNLGDIPRGSVFTGIVDGIVFTGPFLRVPDNFLPFGPKGTANHNILFGSIYSVYDAFGNNTYIKCRNVKIFNIKEIILENAQE